MCIRELTERQRALFAGRLEITAMKAWLAVSFTGLSSLSRFAR